MISLFERFKDLATNFIATNQSFEQETGNMIGVTGNKTAF
jgi:hypothetical protein